MEKIILHHFKIQHFMVLLIYYHLRFKILLKTLKKKILRVVSQWFQTVQIESLIVFSLFKNVLKISLSSQLKKIKFLPLTLKLGQELICFCD